MRIYKTTFYDKDEGQVLSWHGSKRAAEQDLRRQQRERKDAGEECLGPEGVEPMDIEPTRAGLLSFLNAYFTRDNG